MEDGRRVGIREVATVIRSKNAGPFRYTLDIVFSSSDLFASIRDTRCISNTLIAELYGVHPSEVDVIWFAPANALKITLVRPESAASFRDRDAYGAQQHAPLLALTFPSSILDCEPATSR
jgi:hypothetical protein